VEESWGDGGGYEGKPEELPYVLDEKGLVVRGLGMEFALPKKMKVTIKPAETGHEVVGDIEGVEKENEMGEQVRGAKAGEDEGNTVVPGSNPRQTTESSINEDNQDEDARNHIPSPTSPHVRTPLDADSRGDTSPMTQLARAMSSVSLQAEAGEGVRAGSTHSAGEEDNLPLSSSSPTSGSSYKDSGSPSDSAMMFLSGGQILRGRNEEGFDWEGSARGADNVSVKDEEVEQVFMDWRKVNDVSLFFFS